MSNPSTRETEARPPRYLITRIPQIDGGTRELYAATARGAREAKEQLRNDPALVECLDISEYVDVERDGSRTRYVR